MTLLELKDEMLSALSHRKKSVLPIALDIFNRIQDKSVVSFKEVGAYDKFDRKEQVSNIDENLDKLKYVLKSASSPILSTLNETQNFAEKKLGHKYDFTGAFDQSNPEGKKISHDTCSEEDMGIDGYIDR